MDSKFLLKGEETTITLQDEDGKDLVCTMICTFENEGNIYAVLVVNDDNSDDGYMLRIDNDGEHDYLVEIEDEEEWQRAVDAYSVIATLDEA